LAVDDVSTGIDLFTQKVCHIQQDRIVTAEEIATLKARLAHLSSKNRDAIFRSV
jgi:hypothetical protein